MLNKLNYLGYKSIEILKFAFQRCALKSLKRFFQIRSKDYFEKVNANSDHSSFLIIMVITDKKYVK